MSSNDANVTNLANEIAENLANEIAEKVFQNLLMYANNFGIENSDYKKFLTSGQSNEKIVFTYDPIFFRVHEQEFSEQSSQSKGSSFKAKKTYPKVINPNHRFVGFPAYLDPVYLNQIVISKENPILMSAELQLMPQPPLHLNPNILYLKQNNNFISVRMGCQYLFNVPFNFAGKSLAEENFLSINRGALLAALLEVGARSLKCSYWDENYFLVEDDREIQRDLNGEFATFLEKHKPRIVTKLFSLDDLTILSPAPYNLTEILPNVFVGEAPIGTSHTDEIAKKRKNSFFFALDMLGIKTVIALGAEHEYINNLSASETDASISPFCQIGAVTSGPAKLEKRRMYLSSSSQEGVKNEFDCYHLKAWPDREACSDLEQLRAVLDIVKNANVENPVFVHCLAGLGRSGVVAGIVYLKNSLIKDLSIETVEKLKNGTILGENEKTNLVNIIVKGVNELREKRPGLIQSMMQLQQLIQSLLLDFTSLTQEAQEQKKSSNGAKRPVSPKSSFFDAVPPPAKKPKKERGWEEDVESFRLL